MSLSGKRTSATFEIQEEEHMSALRNVGPVDRVVRTILGVAIVAIGVAFHSWWGVVGAVPLLTAALGFCPLYSLLRISTNKSAQHSAA